MQIARTSAHLCSIRDLVRAQAEMSSAIESVEVSYGYAAKMVFLARLIEQLERRGVDAPTTNPSADSTVTDLINDLRASIAKGRRGANRSSNARQAKA
ncbi:hypothetical protein D7S86_14765 [Pararobbsia silviterrae]|uniref:Uncharacterized protein n=2 Tax=Pararobbsia silviterrae TaxID=1792498 RepID=A0A494XUM1_9BURK|nr:hypothetical protein D7S86_14765 [Pararobbsia silviterrae]